MERCFAVPSVKLTTYFSEVLDKAGIPSILWDTGALRLYGVPTVILDYSFIVPNELIIAAYEVLCKLEYLVQCHEYSVCCCTAGAAQGMRQPAKSLHFRNFPPTEGELVHLYQMSQIFHPERMPRPEIPGKDLMFASDGSFPRNNPGWGPYPTNLYPVVVLTPYCYIETVYRLLARDIDEEDNPGFGNRSYNWGIAENYFSGYIGDVWPDFFDYKKLNPQFRWIWRRGGPPQPFWVKRLVPQGRRSENVRELKKNLLPWSMDAAKPIWPVASSSVNSEPHQVTWSFRLPQLTDTLLPSLAATAQPVVPDKDSPVGDEPLVEE